MLKVRLSVGVHSCTIAAVSSIVGCMCGFLLAQEFRFDCFEESWFALLCVMLRCVGFILA